MTDLSISSRLIIALDFAEKNDALAFVAKLDPATCILKIGLSMYTRYGPAWIQTLIAQGFKIFLDLKFHDIPNTVAEACKAAAGLGVWMINVHALGGFKMLQAAKHAVDEYSNDRPLLIAVTLLTSLSDEDLHTLGFQMSMQEKVVQLAQLAQSAGLDGVVCSAQEVPLIKNTCGASFLTITPGIRLVEDAKHDQVRCMTPADAIANGSDFLVVGRSLTHSTQPQSRIQAILKQIAS